MICAGIDPGSRRAGYAIIEEVGGKIKILEAGLLPIKGTKEEEILSGLFEATSNLIKKFGPQICGVERLYFSKNQKTAMAVSQARGAIISSLGQAGVPIKEFTPNEIKLMVAGSGNADKTAVSKMVKLIIKAPNLNLIDDAMDALAIALCAARSARLPVHK